MDEFKFLHDSFEGSSHDGLIRPQVYLVEDDQIFGKTIKKYLEKKIGVEVHFYSKPSDCLEALENKKNTSFCLVTDISFEEGGADGLLLVDILKEKGHNFVSIVMTGFASIETAITATKKGVYHYLTKPFEVEILSDLVVKSMCQKLGHSKDFFQKNKSEAGVKKSAPSRIFTGRFKLEQPADEDIFCGMIGRSNAMHKVFERINKVADSDSTVLINGPSGTGKELVAKALHCLSSRKNNELVSVNCGAIPSELLESELFGHVKGSFTGAISDRKGRFELADNGSIFLDEIGDMPLLLQVKMLRVLQSREIERIGCAKTTPVNVRIITATHRDLEKLVQQGDFREDLFYRLNVIPIKIPSLSERREDIPLLIGHFHSRFVSADGRNAVEFDDDALEVLMSYDWPGNVRELENLIERLVILRGGSRIRVSDLPAKFLRHSPHRVSGYEQLINLPDTGLDLKKTLSEIEDSLIAQALELTKGNKNRSKLLNMNRTTLIEKMKKKVC